ncbi:restriction endonuclease subunit S [Streptococcus anginosus]|uniref:restriction endonuclease subunit S n=1 Tax=Streptococcus anginosus TaxID=1328 RepID=UPI0012440D91|nr:restriction endonuclease subunit S [Streptococcus anginosus]KAA9303930.1 restriction endonuclease subunit S [Streptococcus anginosus]
MGIFKFDEIAFNSTEKKKPVDEDKYTYLGLEHLDSDSIYVTRYGADVAPKGDKLIMKKGDVLFGKRRAYQKKVAIAPFDGIFSAHGMVLRPKEDVIDKEFFPMFIKSDYFLDAAIKISVGSLSPTINWRDLKELKFELPSLEKQRKLAEVLWAIYDMKDKYKKLILATDELVKSQFIEMFKKCNREKLGDYILQIRGVSYKPKDLSEGLKEGFVTLLRANNIANNVLNFEDVQFVSEGRVSDDQIIREGDILICASSGSLEHVGKAALCMPDMEYTFGAFCKLIRPIGKLYPEYIAGYMRTDAYRNTISDLAQGSNINNLRNEHINDLMIPIPSDEQQRDFIDFQRQSDKSKFALQEAIKDLDALSKKIIAENLIPAGKE